MYFISETYIKEQTPLTQNIDIALIVPNIKPAQDLHITKILGKNFYTHLIDAYSAQTLTNIEIELVELIQPALAYRAAEMSLPFINYQVKNKGTQTQYGDNSDGVEMSTTNYLRNELENRAEAYAQDLIKYLKENGSQFPQYITDNTDSDLSTPFDCGIVFYTD